MSSSKNQGSSWKRFKQIVSILRKHHIQKGMDPVKLRLILEDLGPTYVKIGQIMSTRQDVFSQRYCEELVKLRSSVTPLPYETILEVRESQYRQAPSEIFETIDEVPLGSASIAQVHAATLKDGRKVVIKVQRPGIYKEMEEDVELIRKAVKILNLSETLTSIVDMDTVVDEFWTTAQQEMDFRHEAASAKRFKEMYADVQYIGAPTIVDAYTTSHVLVMEYIGGIEIDDIVTLDKEGYARSEICEKLAYNYVNQIIDVGFFHADPHAGNLRIDEGKIVWIDFGMMGELTPRDRDLMKQGVRSLVNRDSALLVETILTLGTSKKEIDHAKFTVEMDRFMNKYINMSLSDINLPQMVQEMFAICHQYAIMLPKGISMLARSLITIEGTMRVLDPKTNIMQVLSSYEMELLNINWNRKLKSMLVKAVEAGEDSIELPIHAKHLMEALQKGQLKVNLNLLGSEVPLANLDRMINRIVVCILIASLLLGSSVICTTNMHPKLLGIPLLGVFGFLIAFGMSLWLFVKMLFLHQKNKPF